MLTLFLMLLSPPTSPSSRVEDPRIIKKQIKAEELRQLDFEFKAQVAERKRLKELSRMNDEQHEKEYRDLDERTKSFEKKLNRYYEKK